MQSLTHCQGDEHIKWPIPRSRPDFIKSFFLINAHARERGLSGHGSLAIGALRSAHDHSTVEPRVCGGGVYDSNGKFGKFAAHKDITHYSGLSKNDRFVPKPDNMVDWGMI
jgi:hypothetical protein